MLRVVAHKSAAAARQYYAEGLKREDYYSEGQEVVGKWHGKAAAMLSLSGNVTPEAFAALVENKHPTTGERITPRTKADRTVGYDLNFHAPKSLSVLYGLTGDKEVLKAFRSAVAETMQEIETQADTRVRRKGAQALRTTGNLAWAEFVHFTARPVGGIPDPHLHIHCFTHNLTFDAAEHRWKAAMFRQIKADAPYHEAAFHARLAAKLEALGYATDRTKFGWELKGISRTLIEKFSRRTTLIDELAAAKGIVDSKAKDALGAATREGKRRGLSKDDLHAAWTARLSAEDKAAIAKVHNKLPQESRDPITAKEAVDYAFEKLFERNSVAPQNRLVAEALHYGVGKVTPESIWKELATRNMVVRKVGDEILCTSLDVLSEEVSLLNFVRSGRGIYAPLGAGDAQPSAPKLSSEQRAAVNHILRSRDQVIVVRGAAGVGKTTLMKEAVAQIEAGSLQVFAFAPSAVASRQTQREAGFTNAETVAHLLQNQKLQKQVQGNVIWIDEAGLLGTRDLWQIMQVAGTSTRVILTGDSAQHAPVARGDAFRLFERYAGLRVAEVTQIRRQEPETYRKAVYALSKADLRTGFQYLDELEAIIDVKDDGQRYALLAKDYIELSRRGQPPLVVSPTHAESAIVTEAIRDARRDKGQIKGERAFVQYHNLQWETADKKRSENYAPGFVVQFHQNVKGTQRGELFHVSSITEKGEVKLVGADGRQTVLPLKNAERFQVFQEREITLGKGDHVRITRNGQDSNGKRLNNGNVFAVEKFSKRGELVLSNGAVLGPEFGHIAYGYCQTSHSSQSKSVDHVLVAQSSDSFVASSREQFYVSVSRGKSSIKIFTNNREELQNAVGNTSTRLSAVELADISKRDLRKMNAKLDSRQWRNLIESRKTDGLTKNHVANLMRERRQPSVQKTGTISWRQYVEMRRGLAGPDGKSRSKGHPAEPSKKRGQVQNRSRSFLRPTELRTSTKERMAAKQAGQTQKPGIPPAKQANAKATKPGEIKPESRQNRFAKAYQNSAQHLKRVTDKLKDNKHRLQQAAPKLEKTQSQQAAKQAKPKPQGSVQQAAAHAQKSRAAEASAQKQVQQVKAKTAAPPPPAPKK